MKSYKMFVTRDYLTGAPMVASEPCSKGNWVYSKDVEKLEQLTKEMFRALRELNHLYPIIAEHFKAEELIERAKEVLVNDSEN